MRKLTLTALLLCLTVSGTVSSQNIFNRLLGQKEVKNHFGIGVTTNLLDGNKDFNRFTDKTFYGLSLTNESYSLDLHSTTAYSIYLEYQYDISEDVALALRAKYIHRGMEYYCFHSLDNAFSGIDVNHVNLDNLEVPIMLRYSFCQKKDFAFVGIFGFGANFKLSSSTPELMAASFNTVPVNYFKLDIEHDIMPFIQVGFATDYKLNKRNKIETNISYTIYPNNYQYNHYYKDANGNSVKEAATEEFFQNNLEVGVALFF